MNADIQALLSAVSHKLKITRPLAAFDLETTGVNTDVDRIVEITIGRVEPDDRITVEGWQVNPGRPIPAEATAIHGITDEMVTHAPPFKDIAPRVAALLSGADLVGFNHRRFDARMVGSECARLGALNPCDGARFIDVGLIFMKREPRTLTAAMSFFCGETHEDAHGTTADVTATLRVLLAQFDRYADLPTDIDALDAMGVDTSFIDREGKFIWRGGKACVGFGKYQGVPLTECDRGFLRWMLTKDFSPEAKRIASDALNNRYPSPPPMAQAS
jgi:DNA polymerase-3 subunit epsilon